MMKLFSKIFPDRKKIQPPIVTIREGEPKVYSIYNENETMIWGIEKAKLTFHYFKECLKNPKSGQDYFSVKVKISDGENIEHIWLIKPDFDEDGNLFGIIANESFNVKTVNLNQQIGIESSLVTDWMIIQAGRLIGGYTIRAIRDGLADSDLQTFDNDFGLIIDEGEDYFNADFSTPEGAIICIENAFNERDIEKAICCKEFHIEAELIAVKNGFNKSQAILESLSEGLELSFIKHLQDNGIPSFKNVMRAFPKREKISDKHYIITEVVYFPDGRVSQQRINTYLTDNGWKVLHPED